MYCDICLTKLEEDAKFCPQCGNKIETNYIKRLGRTLTKSNVYPRPKEWLIGMLIGAGAGLVLKMIATIVLVFETVSQGEFSDKKMNIANIVVCIVIAAVCLTVSFGLCRRRKKRELDGKD